MLSSTCSSAALRRVNQSSGLVPKMHGFGSLSVFRGCKSFHGSLILGNPKFGFILFI